MLASVRPAAPHSLQLAEANLRKALWLLQIRTAHLSPPLAPSLLALPEEFIAGNKAVIWGLLWELRQVYSPAGRAKGPATRPGSGPGLGPGLGPTAVWTEQGGAVDGLLLDWLRGGFGDDSAVLTEVLGRGHPTPTSLVELVCDLICP